MPGKAGKAKMVNSSCNAGRRRGAWWCCAAPSRARLRWLGKMTASYCSALSKPTSRGAARSDYQPPMADVLGGTQNGACWSNNHYVDGPACRFCQGTGSSWPCLCAASELGDACCGAVEPHHRLEPRLRSPQADLSWCATASKSPAPRKSRLWRRVTTVFRFIHQFAPTIICMTLN